MTTDRLSPETPLINLFELCGAGYQGSSEESVTSGGVAVWSASSSSAEAEI